MRLPHGYSNLTCLVDGVVEKRHQGPERFTTSTREAGLLEALAAQLPVPKIIAYDPDEPLLRMEFISGTNGQSILHRDATLASDVLRECGRFLNLVHAADPGDVSLLGEGGFIHGDYGLHNVLFESDPLRVCGIVDWENARRGEAVEDLAWAEWIVRYHHPDSVSAVPALFEGYGVEVSWDDRHCAMLLICDRALQRATNRDDPERITGWRDRIEKTRAWA